MRLSHFIRLQMAPILQDWEEFSETIHHAKHMCTTGLRDHARQMLMVIADDLDSHQSNAEQAAKSKGQGPKKVKASWAAVHGGDRQKRGFSVMETVAEFRALRASVISHWTTAYPSVSEEQLEDLTRFHEAIDQAVAESLEQYSATKEMHTHLFGAILVASPDPIYVLDIEGKIVYANNATADLFALDPEKIIGKTTHDLGCSYAADFQKSLEKVIADQAIHRGQFIHTSTSGQGERFEYLLAPVLDKYRRTEATVCISRDITEQAIAEEKIWYNAHHDLLTGLPNRRLFLDRLEQKVKHAKRNNLPFALLFMDLNGFKEVNDSFGHEAGDKLLSDVAKRLADCVREEDTVARLGGDEFTVILPGAHGRRDAQTVAQMIVNAFVIPFHVAQQPIQISVSIGISFYPRDGSLPLALLQAADKAMYNAKKSGDNWIFFMDAVNGNTSSLG